MTPKKEDYLKIIFELGGRKKKVSNKQIAVSLNIAAGSVTEMVRKLVREGLVHHEPYAGISLTSNGVRVAEELIRRHRLWETFLVTKLDYPLQDVHEDAEVLEHATSDKLMDHLDKFLGYPKRCPHGGIIPNKNGDYEEDSHDVLGDMPDGASVEVDRFIDNHDLLAYLAGVKLQLGDKITVISHKPFEGPIEIKVEDTGEIMEIGYKAAHYIFVK
ncbi:metal-dependent transcriptional regulator [Ligilactobacillus cholophilus]|uniref:metal-dependent transcriptional regulator n=1 Tax=Ligilactobacillus cholophilus TaxID=3050131 RepID=UPI0025AEE94A|nr:metal-dependent transcriptional regulator [Ligilactobacillus cholophilus]